MQRGSKGFTLVELSVVIAILSVLALVAIPRFTSARVESSKKVCYANRNMIARSYQIALTKDKSITLQNFSDHPENYGQYYANKPFCPSGGTYTATGNKIICSQEGHADEAAAESGITTSVTSNSLILTMQALAGLDKTEIKSGMKLNEELKKALGGVFLPVEDYIIEMAFGEAYNGGTLTWRTDTASSTTQIFFAGDGGSDHSNWQAYLVVVDGVLYKTKATEKTAL